MGKLIRYEAGFLNYLQGIDGVPKFYNYMEKNGLQIMSLEYLENDLETVIRK